MKVLFFYLAVIATSLSANVAAFAQSPEIEFGIRSEQPKDDSHQGTVVSAPWGSLPPDSKNLPTLVKRGGDKQFQYKLHSDIAYMNGSKKVKDSLDILTGEEFAFIDEAQNVIVPFGRYDYAEPFGLGRKAIVSKDWKYGIIDERGELVLPLDYDFVERPSTYSTFSNIFVATKKDTVTIFDQNVNFVPVEGVASYQDRGRWGNLMVSDARGKMGRLDYDGVMTIPMIYDTMYQSRDAQYIAAREGRYGVVTENNRIIKPFKYHKIYPIKRGTVFTKSNGKTGLWNEEGRKILPTEYEAIYNTWYDNSDPDDDIYIVVKNGHVGTVDIHNNVVIPIIYDGLSGWVEYGPEAHFVKQNGKYGLISYKGEIIIPIEYEYVGIPMGGVIVVRKNGNYGVISTKNKEILPCIYDRVINDIPFFVFEFGEQQEPKLVVLHNDIWSYFDVDGKLIRENIPLDEMQKEYGYMLEWGEPSNEHYDFDMKQAPKEVVVENRMLFRASVM
jgi:hypothetical protein